MAEPGSRRRGLAIGGGLLALVSAAALLAPVLATDLPWISRGAGGLGFPVLRQWGGAPGRTADPGRALLRAPIHHAPNRIDLDAALSPPSGEHWMGTDPLGRDIASRVVHGARVSLTVGMLSAAFALLIGIPLGALAGYRGGIADAAVSRLIEAALCFPSLLLVLAALTVASGWLAALSDATRIALVIGLTGWMPAARYLRGEFLRLRASEMVVAARASGGGHLRIIGRHILPSAVAPVLVTAAFAVGAAIGLEAALSFLGLGVRPPVATWGVLLADSRELVHRAWWLALFPGIALFIVILACNLLAEGLRDWLDPRSGRP